MAEDNTTSHGTIAETVDSELALVAKEYPPYPELPSAVRRRLNDYRSVLRRYLQTASREHEKTRAGIEISRMLTELIDRFVIHSHTLYFGGVPELEGLAIVALGGYGRSELNPYSDIDILCLVREDRAEIYDGKIGDALQFLWDMNLDLGHSTRTTGGCIRTAETDSAFATSLLDARFIVGDETVWERHRDRCAVWHRESPGRKLVLEKIEERRQRLMLFHDTVQIQEPNIKECPGALRDIHVARWLLILSGKGRTIDIFRNTGYLTEREAATYESDLDFYLSLRHALHFLNGKRSDLLDHLILPEAAERMGYTGEGIRPIERLMHDYYMRAARVRRLTDRIVTMLSEELNAAPPQHFTRTKDGILIGERDVRLAPEKIDSLAKHPQLILSLCMAAGSRELPVSGDTAAAIERTIAELKDDFPEREEVQSAFRKAINMKKGVGRTFRLLHEHGVLTKLIPEFDEISWHYQYDFYHTYTTDEHSIRVVENLERIAIVTNSSIRDLHEIMGEVTAKGALYLAGLLHDIGKKEGRGHAHRGETMAARALNRLGCEKRTIELVRFLIREHLLMSHISQRRDTDDDETIGDFIQRVGSVGRLRMLTLITFADLMALSESAMTEWKKTLLRGLYGKALILIEKGYEEQIVSVRKHSIDAIVKALSKTIPAAVVREHLDLLPDQYIRVTGRSSIRGHIRGIELMKKRGVWATFQRGEDITLLKVITRDHPRALSDICGTITSSDINIVGARIFTRNDGIIIDTFLVMNGDGGTAIPPETQKMFKQNIASVVKGEADVQAMIDSYHRRWRRRRKNVVFSPPRIRVHNDISTRYTVIDVFAIDYTGLLYDITSVLASHNIDIHTAKIGTDEDQVADAFYIQGPDGGKIEDESTIEELKQAVIDRLKRAY